MSKENNEKSGRSAGYLLTYYFINELDRAFIYRFRFGQKVVNGYVGQSRNANFPLGEPAAAVRTKSNFIISNIIAKCQRFFLRHSCHNLLLKAKPFNETLASFHRMKNRNSAIINRIIHDFNGISSTIKTNNSEFFRKFLNNSVNYFVSIILVLRAFIMSSLVKLCRNADSLNSMITSIR